MKFFKQTEFSSVHIDANVLLSENKLYLYLNWKWSYLYFPTYYVFFFLAENSVTYIK